MVQGPPEEPPADIFVLGIAEGSFSPRSAFANTPTSQKAELICPGHCGSSFQSWPVRTEHPSMARLPTGESPSLPCAVGQCSHVMPSAEASGKWPVAVCPRGTWGRWPGLEKARGF